MTGNCGKNTDLFPKGVNEFFHVLYLNALVHNMKRGTKFLGQSYVPESTEDSSWSMCLTLFIREVQPIAALANRPDDRPPHHSPKQTAASREPPVDRLLRGMFPHRSPALQAVFWSSLPLGIRRAQCYDHISEGF